MSSDQRRSGETPSRKPSTQRKSEEAKAIGSKHSFIHRKSDEPPNRKFSETSGSGPSNPYALGPKFSAQQAGGIRVPAAVAIGVERPSEFAYKPVKPSRSSASARDISKPKKEASTTALVIKQSKSKVVAPASKGPTKPGAPVSNLRVREDQLDRLKALLPPPTKTGQKTGIDMLLTGDKITIPNSLPDLLKQYAKAAMRTQPPDLLKWSGAYFRAMANGDKLPEKDRLEDPIKTSRDGLSPGIIRVFDHLLGDQGGSSVKLPKNSVVAKWMAFGLKPEPLDKYMNDAGLDQNNLVEWDKLVAVLANTIGENLTETMTILCDILTDQDEGKEATMKYQKWWMMYTYLANLKGVSQGKIQAVNEFLLPISYNHEGTVGPRDFTTPKCPPLE